MGALRRKDRAWRKRTCHLHPAGLRSHPQRVPLHIDLHCHSWFSADGVSSPEELIASARSKGLHGFAITDHNTCDAYHYMVDHGFARRDGLPVDGFLILPGVEVSTAAGHLLCIGTVLPQMKGEPAADVARAIRAAGGLAIPAHPYDRFRAGIRGETLETLEVDAIEVFNAAISHHSFNDKARAYAESRGLPMITASDAHHEAAIGTSRMIFETDDFSVRGILAAIVKGGKRHEQLLSFRDKLRKTLNNWFRLRRCRTYTPKP
jgi:predicted metal-dependent phosphoesterase TrpH